MIRRGAILWRWLAQRHLRRHGLRSCLALGSIAVGVATFVAMSLLNDSTLESFARTARSRSGGADYVVEGGLAGVDLAVARDLAAHPGIRQAAPLMVREVSFQTPTGGAGTLWLAGVDLASLASGGGALAAPELLEELADPATLLTAETPVFVGADWARAQRVSVGAELQVQTPSGTRPVQVAGTLKAEGLLATFGGRVAVTRLGRVQELFQRPGRADRVLVALGPAGQAPDRAALERLVGGRGAVRSPAEEAQDYDAVHGSLRLALRLLSLVSLTIAAFLVHTTVAMALTERRRELAVLRCVGLTRRGLRRLLWGEALVLGLVGAALGVPLGMALAELLTGLFWSTVGSTFDRIDVVAVGMRPSVWVTGLAAGPLAALLAGFWPVWRHSSAAPLVALRGEQETTLSWRATGLLLALALLLVGAGAVLLAGDGFGQPQAGYWLFGLLTAAVAAGAWPVLRVAAHPLKGWFLRVLGPGGRLARDHFERSYGATALTLVAISMGFGLVFSTDVIVRSFEVLLRDWFRQSIREDLFVVDSRFLSSGLQGQTFGAALGDAMERLDGVQHVQRLRLHRTVLGPDRVVVLSFDGAAPDVSGALRYREGGDEDRRALREGRGVFVSEGLSFRQGWHRGDVLSLSTPAGPRDYPVLAVVVDYTWPLGTLYLDDDEFVRSFGVTDVHEYALTLAPGADPELLRTRLRGLLVDHPEALVLTRQEIMDSVFGVFREYWSLLLAQETLAVGVAFLGTLHTLLISVYLRRREIGVLQAIGAGRRLVGRMIRVEGVLLGLGGGAFGLLFGWGVAAGVLRLLSLAETGFTTPVAASPAVAALTLAGATGTGWLAGWLPSRRAGRIEVLSALSAE